MPAINYYGELFTGIFSRSEDTDSRFSIKRHQKKKKTLGDLSLP